MKKSDIIQLVKETVAERRKRYGQHDYYGNNVGGRNSISGMPGVWEKKSTSNKVKRQPFPAVGESESTSFKVVNADTGKTIDFGIDQAKAEEIVAAAKEDNINAKVVKMKNVDDVGKLKESQGTLASDMLNYADQYHMELVDTMKGVSTYPDKRTGGFYIKFPHFNGPGGRGVFFGRGTVDQIDRSKAAAKAAAQKTVSKFQDQIEDYEITDKSRAGVYGSVHLWIMPKDMNENKDNEKVEKEIEVLDDVEGIENLTINISEEDEMAPKEMAQRIKDVFDMVNGARNPVQTPEFWKVRFRQMYGIEFPENLKNINKQQALAMNKFGNDMKKHIKQEDLSTAEKEYLDAKNDETLKDKQLAYADELEKDAKLKSESPNEGWFTGGSSAPNKAKGFEYWARYPEELAQRLGISVDNVPEHLAFWQAELEAQGYKPDLSKAGYQDVSSPLAEYMEKRGDSNLMEHMDRHKKRATLMEGAMKRLFIMFDDGMTDEEVVQDHAVKGVEVPEAFISKIRKQWENLKKAELELEMGEKEFKNAARDIVNNPEGGEMGMEVGMEPPMEEKQLASGITN